MASPASTAPRSSDAEASAALGSSAIASGTPAPGAPATAVGTAAIRAVGAALLVSVGVHAIALSSVWEWSTAEPISRAAGVAFLFSTAALLVIAWRTGAVGAHPAWRTTLALATTATVVAAVTYATDAVVDEAVTAIYANATWYVVMVSMLVVGVGIVGARRWRSPLRYLPVLAFAWPVVVLTASVLGNDDDLSWLAYVVYFAITQTALALTLVVRPDLAVPQLAAQNESRPSGSRPGERSIGRA